jgi:uncharacterized membrane protein YphA (DoxX/SURF4 family)
MGPATPPDGTRLSDGPRERPSVAAWALLPLRLFFGATFLYAGVDKLILDRGFFDPNSPTSIQAQFTIFERVSPLAPLVHLVEPIAPLMGVLIALGEIGAGLGVLTGLGYRLAALGGALLSFLFVVDASLLLRQRPAIRVRRADARPGWPRQSVRAAYRS